MSPIALKVSRWLRSDKTMAFRLSVASRTGAAVLGGYALAHALPVALLALLAVPPSEGALAAIQLSFLVHVAAILWCFAARSATRAWAGLLIPALLSSALGWAVL